MKLSRTLAVAATILTLGVVLTRLSPRNDSSESLLPDRVASRPVLSQTRSTENETRTEQQALIPMTRPELKLAPEEMWTITPPRLTVPPTEAPTSRSVWTVTSRSTSPLLLPNQASPQGPSEPTPVTLSFLPQFPEKDWGLPQPQLSYDLPHKLTAESLAFSPKGGRLRPRSPYCMPGHTSQNFVVYSAHDGLPLHPGVW